MFDLHVKKFALLPDTEDIKFVNFDLIEHRTLRIEMKIKGIHFKRIFELGSTYKPCWTNEDGKHGDKVMVDEPEATELENIFKAYLLEQHLDIMQMVGFGPRRLRK